MIIPIADWQPDAADLSGGAVQVKNAVPGISSYQPFADLAIITDTIAGTPIGGLEAYDKDDVSHLYVGDSTALYELDESDLTWTDRTNTGGAYTTASGERWNMVRWKNKILATNFADNPQQITMGGANFSDLTTDFRARNVTVVDDFVVFSNTYDATDGNVPNRIRWSAIDDETDYTVSPTTLSNFRDLPTGGPIRRIIGGEVGIIVCERAIYRMDFIGAPNVFQTDEIQPDIGTIAGGAVTSLGDEVYLISDQGFWEITGNGTGKNPIGAGRVDQWFFDELDPDYSERIVAIPDPANNRIFWAFPGEGNTAGRPNRIIIYDRTFQKWGYVEEEIEFMLRAKGIGVTLEALEALGFTDLDAMGLSLDSNVFKAAAAGTAAFGPLNSMGFFAGDNKTAVMITNEAALSDGVTHLKSFSPLVDGGTTTARVGSRRKMQDDVTWSSSLTLNDEGKFTTRVSKKFMRFELSISGEWTDCVGVQIDPRSDVTRGGSRG